MELIRKPIHYTQEGKSIFDQFHLDEDYNLPEQKEDVGQIVQGNAEFRAEDIRAVENYIRVTGKICFQILYMTSSGDPMPAVLEGKLPFEEMIYAESGEGESFFLRNVRTEFSVSVVHARKLGLKVLAEIEIGRECLRDEELTEDVESDIPVFRKKQKMNLLRLAVSKRDTYRIKEEITIPGTKESIGQILVTDICSKKMDVRAGYGELYLRGELLVFCMYMSPDGKTDWLEQNILYEGRIPCEGAEEGMYYHIQHSLEDPVTDLRLDEDGEMRILGIEATVILRMNLYEEQETELLMDLYSLEQDCILERKNAVYEELLVQNQSKCKVTERLSLPELKDNVLQIIHSKGSVQAENIVNGSDGIQIEGVLHISFLYLRGDDTRPYGSWQGMVPFSYLIEYPDMPEDVNSSLAYRTEQMNVTLAGSDAVEIKAVLTFDCFLRKKISTEMITAVSTRPQDLEALAERPGIVGHIVQKGEDLWGLAKKYLTTAESIMDINGLENQNIKAGDKLLIFKENISIL